jgi:predicted secreted Zn-dependent protease
VQINLQDIFDMLADVRERYQREEEQGIRQRDLERARMALAGKDACERIKTEIELRTAWLPSKEADRPIPIRHARRSARKAGGE